MSTPTRCCADAPHKGNRCPDRGDGWPDRPTLRASLLAAGCNYQWADVLAIVSQYDRPDVRAIVNEVLG